MSNKIIQRRIKAMAKPDLQAVYVDPSDGNLRRLDGKLGLKVAFENMVAASGDSNAEALGVPIGGLYHITGTVHVRLS
jgi:hypothetical protein